ncbi:vWA domain-containing protein [Dactylosporangium salmoneum]|uniref:VWFA domain-containing protein n=1 Tax=Dactylosporangium salmoneum TaxID=53361 RepID=A0ABN3HCL2_9ACTN
MLRRVNAWWAVFAMLAATTVMVVGQAAPAGAFGTVAGMLDQHSEHERITRAALACPSGTTSKNGECFEPRSMDILAGHFGAFGAVGSPDVFDMFTAAAHCDDADYFDTPGYHQKREQATAALQACVDWMRSNMEDGVEAAGKLVGAGGVDVIGSQVDLNSDCFLGETTGGEAKCVALGSFGAALHTAQDFYSHSNWTDQTVGTPSVTNPPGLNLPAPSRLLDLTQPKKIELRPEEKNFTTGSFYKKNLVFGDCYATSTEVTHGCLNKDRAIIDPVTGAVSRPTDDDTGKPGKYTPRGEVGGNEQRAVAGAIAETKRQWEYFKQQLKHEYGDATGQQMILALTQDIVKIDLVFVIDTTGSMSPYINGVVGVANDVVDVLTGRGPNAHITDYRIGLVDFKDVDSSGCESSYDAVTDLDLTTSRQAIVDALKSLPGKVSGGCDFPEDQLSGVQRAVNFPWRAGVQKVVLLMTDAPGHDPEPHSGLTTPKVVQAALDADPVLVFPMLVGGNATTTSFVTALATGTGGKTISTTSGVGPALLAALQNIVAMPSADDSSAPTVVTDMPAGPSAAGGFFDAGHQNITGTVTAKDPSKVTAIDCVDSGGKVALGPIKGAGTGTASRSVTVTGDGVHQVSCWATDGAPAPHSGAGAGSSPIGIVLIDAGPPTLTCKATPSVLEPADGRLVPVTVAVTVDDAGSGPAGATLTAVTNSRADDGHDDVQGFAVGTEGTSGQLRADAAGGAGRRYTLTYTGRDAAGNTATCAATVIVAGTDEHPTPGASATPTTPGAGGTGGATPGGGGPLAVTGGRPVLIAGAGLGLILLGAAIVIGSAVIRRRRTATTEEDA